MMHLLVLFLISVYMKTRNATIMRFLAAEKYLSTSMIGESLSSMPLFWADFGKKVFVQMYVFCRFERDSGWFEWVDFEEVKQMPISSKQICSIRESTNFGFLCTWEL